MVQVYNLLSIIGKWGEKLRFAGLRGGYAHLWRIRFAGFVWNYLFYICGILFTLFCVPVWINVPVAPIYFGIACNIPCRLVTVLGLERRMTEPLASLEKENFRPSNTIYLASNQDNMGNMLLINKIITKIGRFRAVFRNI